jgi:acyl-CoA synthetase (AMP-forming)/AMP-acid ligase II
MEGDAEDPRSFERMLDPEFAEGDRAAVDDETICMCIFTSGTTGDPKGVMQSQGMLRHFVETLLMEYRVTSDEFRYAASPMFHIGGLAIVLMGILKGYPHLILPQFDPDRTIEWLRRGELTGCEMVPTMISAVLDRLDGAPATFPRLRTLVYGAAPITPDLLRRALATFDCEFIQGFGVGTEAGLQAVLRPEDHRLALQGREEILTSVGKAAYGVELRICDDDWNDLPTGTMGEIVGRSQSLMSGYFGAPDATLSKSRDGWFRGGDAGWFDEDGYLYLGSRKKDMIIRGGVNIYPLEIEAVLCDHPDVAHAAVVGRRDPEWGEVVVAFVQARKEQVDTTQLQAHCRERLASYKVPADIFPVREFELNASGKIVKEPLRARVEGARA